MPQSSSPLCLTFFVLILRKMKKIYPLIIVVILILALRQLSFHSEEQNPKTSFLRDNEDNFQDQLRQEKIPKKDVSKRTGLSTNSSDFLLDGKKFRILSGEIHYFRFPYQYWKDRLLALKASGLNALTTYIPWNSHEPYPGQYNFTGMLDLPKFLELADNLDIYVILRVGPYICAEWEYGGLPSWLLRKNAKVRTMDPVFISHVGIWFDKLLALIKPYQYTNGGPVIAVQVENEYSSFPDPDPLYIKKLKNMVEERGIKEFLFVCDDRNGVVGDDKRINYVGMLKSINLQNNPAEGIKQLKKAQPNYPAFVSEYWTGWFNWWGGPHHNLGVPWLNTFDVPTFVKSTEELLVGGASMNLYVFAGGTNFGFMNGAITAEHRREKNDETWPDTTSYDYDAPVSEEGRLTDKYFALRSLLQRLKLTPPNLIAPPVQPVLANYDSVKVNEYVSLGQLMEAFKSSMIKSEKPIPMENFPAVAGRQKGQSYGYALYECAVTGQDQFLLDLQQNVRDRALVFLDTVYQDTFAPPMTSVALRGTTEGKHTLSLLVENQGRINWVHKSQKGVMDDQSKGIRGDIKCNDEVLSGWRMWPLEFDSLFLGKLDEYSKNGTLKWERPQNSEDITTPALLKATLEVRAQRPLDTFMELSGFEKGFVIVNGENLGRYWNSAGPQKRLYVPGPWLHTGSNEILIFEERIVGHMISFHQKSGLN